MTSSQYVRPLKYAVEACVNGVWGDEPNGIEDMVVVRVADFDRSKGIASLGDSPTVRAIPESARNRRVLRPGDLLIEKSGGGEQQPVGNVVLFTDDRPAVCSNFVARMPVVADCDSRFVGYVFHALYAEGRNVPHIKQTSGIQNLDSESYLNEMAWLPARSKQERIANFLDERTARIDALIAEKERLLKSLADYRQAIVTECVTRGLDKKAPLKDSGSDWIGLMPAHWTRTRLGHLVWKIADGPHFSPEYVADGYPFLSARNIKADRWSLDDVKFVDEENFKEFSKRVIPERGDVLYTKGGTTGVARYVDLTFAFQVWVHVAVLKLRPEKVDGRYLAHALNSAGCYAQSQLYTYGATNNDFGLTRMARVILALPPLVEQEAIADYLDRRLGALGAIGDHVSEHIERLREYRSSLISAAVNGQLDIDAFKAKLPEAA